MEAIKSKVKNTDAILGNDPIGTVSDMRKLVLDSSPLAIMVYDENYECIDCNAAALKLFELPGKKELLEHPFLFCAPIQPNGRFAGDYARELFMSAMESGESIAEWTYRNKSKELIQSEITLKRIDYEKTRIIIIYIRDLRAEMEAQAEVIEITERNKIMIDVTPICFVYFSDSFEVVDCNPAALTLFGVPTAKEFAEEFFMLSPEYQSDGELSTERYKRNMQKAFNDGRLVFEWDHLTAIGEELPVEVVFVRVEYKGSYRLAGYFRDLRDHRAMLREMALAEQKLIEAKEIAEDSTRIKGEFLANMSHEIRTPMNGILGITNLAMKNDMSETMRTYLAKIDQSAKSLLRIINDILDFSKIEAGKLEIEDVEFDINTVLSDIRDITSYSLSQKSLEFTGDISDEIDFNLIGDPLRLHQVLLNITSNAIKFTHEGNIRISVHIVERKENKVELKFAIKDTGIGMSKKQVSRIFDAFGQADSSTTRKYGGTGLGLAISKTLVELMGGRIWVESELGKGTAFYFTTVFGVTERRDISDADGLAENEYQIPDEYKGAHLLLVEDNEINTLIATELLGTAGFTVSTASNGAIAVNMIAENDYELVLMDIHMPEMDGLKATTIIRAREKKEKLDRIPIIAMTANAMQGDRENSLEAGMDDHITKPLVPKTVMQTICTWLNKSKV